MGNHRAERRGPRRVATSEARPVGGKRAARPAPRPSSTRRADDTIALATAAEATTAVGTSTDPEPAAPATRTTPATRTAPRATNRTATASRATDTRFEDSTVTLPVVPEREPVRTTYDVRGLEAQRKVEERAQRAEDRQAAGGRRKAVREPRPTRTGSALRLPVRPSAPVVAGIAVLAISAGGAVTASGSGPLADAPVDDVRIGASSALSGTSVSTSGDLLTERSRAVSRDSQRDALEDSAADTELAQAEAQAERRSTALETLAASAEEQAAIVAANAWVLPVDNYRLTNRFGDARSYYSSGYHTGLDFAAPSGTPIRAVAGGTVTSAGYDGSYGNKTVITLEDGTEMWYAHQSSINVSAGDTVAAGDQIGYVGSTGNSTGPHLHLEVRPGAGDPVDPYRALQVNGVTP